MITTDNATAPRVALFVEWHEGLGHFNIAAKLMNALKAANCEVKIFSGSLTKDRQKIVGVSSSDVVELPPVQETLNADGKFIYQTPSGIRIEDDAAYRRTRAQAVTTAVEVFNPQVVVSELFPFCQPYRLGDIKAVAALKDSGAINADLVGLGRDIMHNRENPAKVRETLKIYFDRLYIRGDEHFTTLARSQPEWANLGVSVSYMGNFLNEMPKRSGPEHDPTRPVVVFGGGGFDCKDLSYFEGVIRARAHTTALADRDWNIYVSPRAREIPCPHHPAENCFDYLARIARETSRDKSSATRILTPIEGNAFRQQLANAAMVVTRGGYNTTFELYAAKTPMLVIPRATEEQMLRAVTLSEHGMAHTYPPALTIATTQHTIDKALGCAKSLASEMERAFTTPLPTIALNNQGADTTAKHILACCRAKADLCPAAQSPITARVHVIRATRVGTVTPNQVGSPTPWHR